jgi:hypothetical protein
MRGLNIVMLAAERGGMKDQFRARIATTRCGSKTAPLFPISRLRYNISCKNRRAAPEEDC